MGNSLVNSPVVEAIEKFGSEAKERRVFVGLSGGIDSQSLLHALVSIASKYQIELTAAHLNHQQSKHADSWEKHCRETCAVLNVEFITHRLRVTHTSTAGKESTLRDLRYSWFQSLVGKADIFVTAHHLDDHVETVLLRLVRGSGVRGLRGIPSCRSMGKGILRRPFLDIWRKDIAAYAKFYGLSWIEDHSNSDEAHDRNFVRHKVITQLRVRWPGCAQSIARSVDHLMSADRLLDGVGAQDMSTMYQNANECRFANFGKIDVAQFNALDIERRNNVLRFWIKSVRFEAPGYRRLSELCRQLLSVNLDSKIRIVFGDFEFRRYRNYLYLLPKQRKPIRAVPMVWRANGSCEMPQTGVRIIACHGEGIGLKASHFTDDDVLIGSYSRSVALRLHRNGRTRTLRNLFQENGIPPWERWRLPVLFLGDNPICVPSIGLVPDFAARKGENGLEIVLEESL